MLWEQPPRLFGPGRIGPQPVPRASADETMQFRGRAALSGPRPEAKNSGPLGPVSLAGARMVRHAGSPRMPR